MMKRTPPPITNMQSPRAVSEPDLSPVSDCHDKNYSAQRFPKRKRESDSDLNTLKNDLEHIFENKMALVLKSIDELKNQNTSISDSIEFVTKQYDSVILELQSLREERRENMRYIQQLESKIEILERKYKSSSLEIKNIPKVGQETKEDLLDVVIKTGNILSVPIQPCDVRDVYRINTKVESNKPIVVELNTVLLRDKFVHKIKEFNFMNKSEPLSTRHLRYSGEEKKIFISESLTLKTRQLFFMARDFSKRNNYDYCWVNHGNVFIRKTSDSRYIRIINEEDLIKLQK